MRKFLGLLVIAASAVALVTACGRVVATNVARVSLSAPTTQVLVDQQVTVSATLSDVVAPYDISWSATSGTLNTTTGITTVFTAPRRSGAVTINISVVKDDRILTSEIVFTVSVPDTTPPAAPTQVQVLSGDNQVTLSWAGNNESDLAGYKVYYGTTSGQYANSVTINSGTSYTLTGLANDVAYYFVVVAVDTNGNASAPSAEVSQTPTDGGAPDAPLVFQARVESTGTGNVVVALTWLNPDNTDLAGIMIRRKAGSVAPVSPTDGTLLYQTPSGGAVAESYQDSAVTLGAVYSYAIFAYDEVPAYSAGTKQTVIVSL